MSGRKDNVVRMPNDWFRGERKPGEKPVIMKRRKLADKYYSLSELAEKMGCGYDLLYKAIRRHELDAEVVGRSYRVSEEAFERYLELCRRKKSV